MDRLYVVSGEELEGLMDPLRLEALGMPGWLEDREVSESLLGECEGCGLTFAKSSPAQTMCRYCGAERKRELNREAVRRYRTRKRERRE